jgi:hypothetical protein
MKHSTQISLETWQYEILMLFFIHPDGPNKAPFCRYERLAGVG